jgi:signal transduction histidine kinase
LKPLSVLPRTRAVALTALALAALGSAASLYLVDRRVEYEVSELQAFAAGDSVDRLTLLQHDQGTPGLVQAVQRAGETASPGQVYLLADASGRKLAGNLAGWPAKLDAEADWKSFSLPGGETARAITAILPGDVRLLVGHTDASRRPIRGAIAAAAAIAFGCLAVALLGVAGVWGRLVGSRLNRLAEAARAVARGARDIRAPVGRRGDGFDEVALAFNQMVDENLHLVGGLEAVTRSLAHDLRTPLMRMRAAIADARAAPDATRQDAALERAEEEAERTVAIFTGLSDLALAESGLSREAMQPLALDQLVQDVVELFEPLAEERGQSLRAEVEAVSLRGHRQLLFQALGNLIANAIRHSPEGAPIDVGLLASGEGAEISVRDRGSGLTATEATEAMRPFVRLHTDEPGLGLGLPIVRAVARLHDGALRLEPANPGLRAVLTLWGDSSGIAGAERPLSRLR